MTIVRRTLTRLIRFQFYIGHSTCFSAIGDNYLSIDSTGKYKLKTSKGVLVHAGKIEKVLYAEEGRVESASALGCFVSDNEEGFVGLSFKEYDEIGRPKEISRERTDIYIPKN